MLFRGKEGGPFKPTTATNPVQTEKTGKRILPTETGNLHEKKKGKGKKKAEKRVKTPYKSSRTLKGKSIDTAASSRMMNKLSPLGGTGNASCTQNISLMVRRLWRDG